MPDVPAAPDELELQEPLELRVDVQALEAHKGLAQLPSYRRSGVLPLPGERRRKVTLANSPCRDLDLARLPPGSVLQGLDGQGASGAGAAFVHAWLRAAASVRVKACAANTSETLS